MGTHIMSLFTQWVPADWARQPHTEELDGLRRPAASTSTTRWRPNFKASILHRDIVGPYEMEQEYGLIGGNIFHGELSLEQLFHMRPAPGYADYRTPIAGLYNGSSGTHAGGGVCGIPGWQAARAALADRKRGSRRFRRVLVSSRPGRRSPRCSARGRWRWSAPARARTASARGWSSRRNAVRRAVHLVNPRYDRIGELPCVPTLADLDEPVDLVLLGVPDAAAGRAVRPRRPPQAPGRPCCSGPRTGCTDQIAAIAADAGMALCGAGCMGFVNNALGVRALGYLEPDPLPDGGVSLVTHSGSAFSTLLRARRGFGFRLAVSSGQELVTDTADYVDYALDDPETRHHRAAARDAALRSRGCGKALLRAAEQDVPVVILTVGGSPRGRAMVAAHSGALAGEQAAWQAFCAATGAVHVSDLAEFTDTLELFSAGAARHARDGIATVHDSGAERALVGRPRARTRRASSPTWPTTR